MASTAPQVHEITTEETRNISVDMTDLLDSGELLTGTPTITGNVALTITNQQRNSSTLTINGRSVAVDNAVQFTLACSTTGLYVIEVQCGTDGSQTIEGYIKVNVVSSSF